jgi:hypothetical protein
MSTTTRPQRQDVVRFVPVGKSRRVTVMVDGMSQVRDTVMVHGVRCNSWGGVDSQSRPTCWPMPPEGVEVIC